MLEFCYEWLENISYYFVLTAVVIHLLPGDNYRKYVRFYLGLVLISIILGPLWNIKNMKFPDFEDASQSLESQLECLEKEYEYGLE